MKKPAPSRGQGHGVFLAVILVAAAILVTQSPVVAAGNWRPGSNLSNTPGRSFQTSAAFDPKTSDLFVAWTDDGLAAKEEVVGRRWDSSVPAWLPTENLSQSQTWERNGWPILSFNEQGRGLLVWTRTYAASQGAPADGYDLIWRAWNGSAWSPESVLCHGESYLPGSPGAFGLIPVEMPNGLLLFIIWGKGYRTATYQDGAWSEVSPWTYLDVTLAQVIQDQDGFLHAAAYGDNSRQDGYNGHFKDAYYLTFDGVAWSDPLNLSSTDGVANNIGLAFDGTGKLHFLWSDPNSPYSDESHKSTIWERISDGDTWTPNTEVLADEPDQAINGFSLAAGATGTLHLAWSEGIMVEGAHTELDLFYRSGDGEGWEAEESVYTSQDASRFPLLLLTGDGPALVWQKVFDADGHLLDHEVYFSRQLDLFWLKTYLPLVSK